MCQCMIDYHSVSFTELWRGWNEMLAHLCRAVLCCLFHPVITEAQNGVMGPLGPQSILVDGRGAANGSRCKPWPSFSPARPCPSTSWALRPQSIWASSTWKRMFPISSLRLNCEWLGRHPAWGRFAQAYYVGICTS